MNRSPSRPYLALAFMVAAGAVVLAAGWYVLQAFLGMAGYIRTAL
jgi:hypothetical protein